jgi:hypothetical protein
MGANPRHHELGPGGECVCPRCGRHVAHRDGVRCGDELCPDCRIGMLREGSEHHRLWIAKHAGAAR